MSRPGYRRRPATPPSTRTRCDIPRALLINHAILFLCCSIYLGTGFSLVFFQFPLEPRLTPDNYARVFVEPVARATFILDMESEIRKTDADKNGVLTRQ